VEASRLATYPDVAVCCGPLQFHADRRDLVLNPTLLVEVLSPSSEAYDRGEKFELYKSMTSLQDYVLISQDQPVVEVFSRAGKVWRPTVWTGLDAVILLPSINVRAPMAELFDGVVFPG